MLQKFIAWAAALRRLTLAALALAAAAPASAQHYEFKQLYAFCATAPCSDGAGASGAVALDKSGNVYGTTVNGGNDNDAGTVFVVSPSGSETALYAFCSLANCVDGKSPIGGVAMDRAGNLYGTTAAGGADNFGTLFELTPGGYTVLYSFCSAADCADGANPRTPLIVDGAGNIYGTTSSGGAQGGGTVFKLTPDGTLTTLYSFCAQSLCADGGDPDGTLARNKSGNLYGTTLGGGGPGFAGVAFRLTPRGAETVLFRFQNPPQGEPVGAALDKAGDVYGVTSAGAYSVFEVTRRGKQRTLYTFCALANCADGNMPQQGVIRDKSGRLFGTTFAGGANGGGTVFELARSNKETVLYSFCALKGCTDGMEPAGPLTMDKAKNLYGVTDVGGDSAHNPNGNGTVFELVRQ